MAICSYRCRKIISCRIGPGRKISVQEQKFPQTKFFIKKFVPMEQNPQEQNSSDTAHALLHGACAVASM